MPWTLPAVVSTITAARLVPLDPAVREGVW